MLLIDPTSCRVTDKAVSVDFTIYSDLRKEIFSRLKTMGLFGSITAAHFTNVTAMQVYC